MTDAFPPPPAPASPLCRILYAEDVRELRDVARRIVGPMGYFLECAEDGRQALDRVEADPGRFDLIVTDHHMPVMNGLEFVRRLRALPYRGKVLVFSSELNAATAAAYRNLRVDLLLKKPVSPRVFRQVLAGLIERKRNAACPV